MKQTTANNLFLYAAKRLFNKQVFVLLSTIVNKQGEDQARFVSTTFGHQYPEEAIFRAPYAKAYHTHQLDSNLVALASHASRYVKARKDGDPLLRMYQDALRNAIKRDAKCQAVFHSNA